MQSTSLHPPVQWAEDLSQQTVTAFLSEVLTGVNSIGLDDLTDNLYLPRQRMEERGGWGCNWKKKKKKKDFSASGNPLTQTVNVNLSPANPEMEVIRSDPAERGRQWLTMWGERRITVMTGQRGSDRDLTVRRRNVSLKTLKICHQTNSLLFPLTRSFSQD